MHKGLRVVAPPDAPPRSALVAARLEQWLALYPDDQAANRMLGFIDAEIALMLDVPHARSAGGSLASRR
jgi:hypothetical protein